MERVALADTEANRAALYKLLLEAELYMASSDAKEEETIRVAEEGETLPVVLLESPDGPVLPVFTQSDRLLEWRPEGSGYIAAVGRAVFEVAEMNDVSQVFVNPGSLTHGSIERWEIEALARGRLPVPGGEAFPAGTNLKVGTAAHKPADDVLGAACEALALEERVARAWLFLFQEGTNAPEHSIAVEFDETTDANLIAELLPRIVERAGSRSERVRELIFVPFDDFLRALANDGIGEQIFER